MIQPTPADASRQNFGSRARKPIDEATLRRLAGQYTRGASIRALVSDTGWAYGTVQRRLVMAQERGLMTIRPKGGARVIDRAAAQRAALNAGE